MGWMHVLDNGRPSRKGDEGIQGLAGLGQVDSRWKDDCTCMARSTEDERAITPS